MSKHLAKNLATPVTVAALQARPRREGEQLVDAFIAAVYQSRAGQLTIRNDWSPPAEWVHPDEWMHLHSTTPGGAN